MAGHLPSIASRGEVCRPLPVTHVHTHEDTDYPGPLPVSFTLTFGEAPGVSRSESASEDPRKAEEGPRSLGTIAWSTQPLGSPHRCWG